jgi:hypothetical protein
MLAWFMVPQKVKVIASQAKSINKYIIGLMMANN